MHCPTCGKEIPDNSKSCLHCGTSMIGFVIMLSPDVTDEQVTALTIELQSHKDKVKLLQALSVPLDPIVIGTITLVLGFAAKAYFDGFLKELGKDTYGWLKARLGIEKAKQTKEAKVQYQIQIGTIIFGDKPHLSFHERHERILQVVNTVCVQEKSLENVRFVELVFDEKIGDYVEAQCYGAGQRGTPPLRILRL